MIRRAKGFGAALGVAALSTLVFAPAFATHDATAEADSSASTGTGPLFEALLDTGACTAVDTAQTQSGTPTGRCGDGLSLNDQINAFSQNASAPGNGTSAADASVAPIDIIDFTSLDLQGIIDGLEMADTGTVLDGVLTGVGGGLKEVLVAAGLYDTAVAEINNAVQEALASVHDELPLSLELGTVESECTATAQPLRAEGDSHVESLDLIIKLGDQQIRVPIEVKTEPNSDLIAEFPRELVTDIIAGMKATFNESLDGNLSELNPALDAVEDQLATPLFDQLEPQLLAQLSEGLAPLIKGTFNKQEPVSPSSTGEIEVTALELILADGQIGELDLARSHCGPNTAGTPHGNPDPNPIPDPDPEPGPPIPTSVDSGLAGDSGKSQMILAGTGALMLLAGLTGLMGYRRMLQR